VTFTKCLEHSRATARAALDETRFTAAWEAGRVMPLEDAIADALGEGPA